MLQTVSYPFELPELWDTEKCPFYLELFGETSPLIDMNYAKVLPAGSAEAIPQNVESVPIYQYWWTIGHVEDLPIVEDSLLKQSFSHEHDDAFATVSMYFPISGGWRIKELLPTIRDLKPFHKQLHMWHEAGKVWNEVAPLFTGLATLPLQTINPLASIPLALLPSFSKLHINTIESDKEFTWSVDKISCRSQYGLMQGVRWNISKKMFCKLGGRLTGSLAVCFIPSQIQHHKVIDEEAEFQSKPILARAVLNLSHDAPIHLPPKSDAHFYQLSKHDAPISLPGPYDFIELNIKPHPPENTRYPVKLDISTDKLRQH
ncbi:MAG TPA: hypothetical protein VEV19_15620 [Ktedonobacteraceae bacterium]|nr:hypothetical protein [Ktedonobacteraceae bacterium]